MDGKLIARKLIDLGLQQNAKPKAFVQFTRQEGPDRLLNDIENHSHLFVFACILDRQMRAERAWTIPYKLVQKVGSSAFEAFAGLSSQEFLLLMSKPEPLHRFPEEMGRNLYEATRIIGQQYGGRAFNIWHGTPSSAEVVSRFLEFRGVGVKIATMAANILARDFKIPFSDRYSIDVSPDVQVRRVFTRLGLVESDATPEQIIYRARSLHPEFPGLFDLSAWEIGRNWCRPKNPKCAECELNDTCPKVV
jgi:endonuclease III